MGMCLIMLYQLLILLIIIQCGTSFTHVYPIISPLTCESLPFCGLQDLFMDYEQVILASPCLMGLSLHWCIIHGLPRVNLARLLSSMETAHLIICLAPLTIILFCWALFKIVCVGFMTFLVQYTVPAPTTKGTRSAPFAKGFQVHTPHSRSNCERNLDNLATLLLDIYV